MKKIDPCPLCKGEYYRGKAEAYREMFGESIRTAQMKSVMVCKNCKHWSGFKCRKTRTSVCGSDRCGKWEIKRGNR